MRDGAFQLVIASAVNGLGSVQLRHSIVLNTRFDRTLIPLSGVITETIAFGSALLLLALMMVVYGIAPTLAILWLPVVIGVTVLFSVSIAYPASLLGLWYADLRTFVISAFRTLFFVAPGLVALDQVPDGAQKWLKLNPLTGIFESYRSVLLYGAEPGRRGSCSTRACSRSSCWRSCCRSTGASSGSSRSWWRDERR